MTPWETWLNSLQEKNIRSISVVGLSKNAGKTTVLNAIGHAAFLQDLTIGLCSIGVDGEKTDVWSGKPKPPVHVYPGQWVATVKFAFDLATGEWEIIERTHLTSVMGDVYIGRCIQEGNILLTGTSTVEAVSVITQRLMARGIRLCLVDGAYDRIAASSPAVTDGMVFVAGAQAGPSISQVAEMTERFLFPYLLPSVEINKDLLRFVTERTQHPEWVWIQEKENGRDLVWKHGKWLDLNTSEKIRFPRQARLLRLGALTSLHWNRLMALSGTRWTIVLEDPSCSFVPYEWLRSGLQQGHKLQVVRSVQLLGVFINPVSPDGYEFDKQEMKQAFERRFPTVTVMDAMAKPTAETAKEVEEWGN
jgi:hypothetical protein